MTKQRPRFIDPRLRRFQYVATQTRSSSRLPSRTNPSTVATGTRPDTFKSRESRHDNELDDLSVTSDGEDNIGVQSVSSDDENSLFDSSPSAARGIKKHGTSQIVCRRSRRSGTDQILSDGIPVKRSPGHYWTDSDKLIMLILIRWFDVNWKEGAKILNACFPNAAVPFACRMVQSYWRDMRKKADKVWVYVYEKVSFTSPDHEVQSIMDKLMQVATKTGFTLKFRHAEDLAKPISPLSTSFRRNERSQRSQTHFLPVYEQQPDDIEGCNEEIPLANFKSEESNVVNLEPEDTLDLDEICQSSDISSDEPPMNTPIYSQEEEASRSRFFNQPLTNMRTLEEALSLANEPNTYYSSHRDNIPPLLFRMFDNTKAGENSAEYFRASYFTPRPDARLPTPAPCTSSMFQWFVSLHLGRTDVGSPFISTTSSLVWTVLMAAASQSKNASTICISVIDSTIASERRSIYHGSTFFDAAKRQPGFVEEKHMRYKATIEYLVWGEIAQPAIQKTILYPDLEELANSDYGVRTILRLDTIKANSRMASLRTKFLCDRVELNTSKILGFAKLLIFFGVTPMSNPKDIRAMAFHIVQGWLLYVASEEYAEEAFTGWKIYWAGIAAPEAQVRNEVYSKAKKAFVVGVMRAAEQLGKEFEHSKDSRSMAGGGRRRRAHNDLGGFVVN